MNHNAEDLASDRTTFRNLAIVVGSLIGLSALIGGWVLFLSNSLAGSI